MKNPYIELLRPSLCLLTLLAVITGALAAGAGLSYILLFACISAFLICGAGNILNDYFDFKIDSINRPDRPIPSKRIKRKAAGTFAVILYIIGNIFAFLILNIYIIFLALFNTLFISFYDWKLKNTAFGHFADSWLPASAFLFGSFLGTPNILILFFMVVSFLSNFGREIGGGIEDIKGDKKAGIKTLTIFLGEKKAYILSIACILASIILSPLPYFFSLLNIYFLILVLIGDAIFLISLNYIFKNPQKSQKLMKLAMLAVLVSFLVGLL